MPTLLWPSQPLYRFSSEDVLRISGHKGRNCMVGTDSTQIVVSVTHVLVGDGPTNHYCQGVTLPLYLEFLIAGPPRPN
jgi:hypothetical protein